LTQTTPNKTQTTNITNPKLNYINYIGKSKGEGELIDDDKHNHQAKLPVLNWHNQNSNITTVEMLIVLL